MSNLNIYKHVYYHQKYCFGDILTKFDGNWTYLIDYVCLLSSPKISTFYAVLQMLIAVDEIVNFIAPVVKVMQQV